MILGNNPGVSLPIPDQDSSSPLDFTLINDQDKSIIRFLAADQSVTPPLTNRTDDDEVECDFCKKVGLRKDFRGRFCNKICVGRFAQRTRLMRKQSEREAKLAKLDQTAWKPAPLVDNVGLQEQDFVDDKEKFYSCAGPEFRFMTLPEDSVDTSEKMSVESGDMEIEIFKPIINYSNGDFTSQKETFIASSLKPVDLNVDSKPKYDDHGSLKNSNLLKRPYSLRMPKKNLALEQLKFEFDIKPETFLAKFKSPLNVDRTDQPKRGRPSKKFLESRQNETNLYQIKKGNNLFKLKENIRESVYLTKSYDDPGCYFKTVGFKIDSKLVGPIDSFSNSSKSLKLWSVDDVCRFVASIPGCEKFVKSFVSEEIDGEALILIKLDDLIKLMQIQLGPALKIFNYISKLKFSMNSTII